MEIKSPSPQKTIIQNLKKLNLAEKVGLGVGGLLLFKFLPLWFLLTSGVGGFFFFKSDAGKRFLTNVGKSINKNNKFLK